MLISPFFPVAAIPKLPQDLTPPLADAIMEVWIVYSDHDDSIHVRLFVIFKGKMNYEI